MNFAVEEFANFQTFSASIRGKKPNAVGLELSKIDLLMKDKHWTDDADAAKLMPVLGGVFATATGSPSAVALRWHQDIGDVNLVVALGSAQLRATPNAKAFRLEFRATMPVTGDLREHLERANKILNEAFARLIPDPGRFS